MGDERRTIPIHRSLHRPDLLAGAERELMLMLILIMAVLIVVAQTWLTTVLAIVLWILGTMGLRMMAKADPYLSKLYLRHIKYKNYYPARSTPFTKE